MLDVIVGDCEVFKHYFLFVAKELPEGNIVVIDNDKDLLAFYEKHRNGIWVFYNTSYDQYIIRAKLCGLDVKALSDHIVQGGFGWNFSKKLKGYPLNCFDAKRTINGLKVLEAYMGEDIEETTVPFDLDRPLTDKEKAEVIKYCTHDVEQTYKVLTHVRSDFLAFYKLCRYFNLPLSKMDKTASRLTLDILDAQAHEYHDAFKITIPKWIEINKYAEVVEWFKSQVTDGEGSYATSYEVEVAGCPCVFAWGGVHGALSKFSEVNSRIVCIDVASLYPSLMINEGYFSRSIKSPQLYIKMYKERLELKKKKDPLANSFKLCLNSAYGTYKDKNSKAYDPLMANNICVAGQLALLDLMEHIEQAVPESVLAQCNTDGIFYVAKEDSTLEGIREQVELWEKRTKLTMEESIFHTIYQRDVNNYILIGDNDKIKGKGVLKKQNPLDYNIAIIKEALQAYLVSRTPIEETVNNCKDYIKFQIVYKRSKQFDAVFHDGIEDTTHTVFRVFADSTGKHSALYRGKKNKDGEYDMAVFPNCPPCYIDNGNINHKGIPLTLNKSWYVDQAKYELLQWLDLSFPL